MNEKPQWFLIETEQEHNKAIARYEQIKNATAGAGHKEKLLLVQVNPAEMIKIRIDDFGLNSLS